MEKMPQDPKEMRYTFSDFWKIFEKSKRLIITSMVLGAVAAASYALTRHVYYLTSATFRDKGKATGVHSSLSDIFFSSTVGSIDSESISNLKSRKLLSRVIQKLGVQGIVTKAEPRYPDLEDFRDNLLAEYAFWLNIKTPILKELNNPFGLRDVSYDGEVAATIVLQFTDDTHFQTVSHPIQTGELGKPFVTPEFSFTLVSNHKEPDVKNSYYAVTFLPMDIAYKIHSALLVIEPDREDKTLLKLKYRHRDRHFAAHFVNTLMATFQEYLKEDHELTSSLQLAYLKERQAEMGESLQALLEKHAKRISAGLSTSGFIDSEKEMDFLAGNLHNLQQKQTEIDFEAKRLRNLKNLDCVHYDQYGGRGDSSIINELLAEIRHLRQQIDLLDLSLEHREKRDEIALKVLLEEQLGELRETREHLKEAEEMSFILANKDFEAGSLSSLKPPQYLSTAWHDALSEKALESKDEEEHFKTHFASYLENLTRLLKLKEATLLERIRHQHDPEKEFQGITLDTARNLFYSYTKELSDTQALIQQHYFVIKELKNPEFEVCSLTAILHDPISAERIAKASSLLINLRDENNRTQKELTRIREELELLKGFLAAHLQQMAELLNLKERLLQDKIFALQSLTLDLSQQRIYVLKKQLTDYIATRLDNLSHEKTLISDYQMDLSNRMSKIPASWASEKIVSQHLETHKKFLENLSNMLESKNISQNLEIIQSMPLDKAVPPINPKSPYALIWAILGAFLGLIGSAGFLMAKGLIRGVPVSGDNLNLADIHYSGTITEKSALSPLLDRDLNTLRKILGYFEKALPLAEKTARKILIVQPQGTDFSLSLASLISKKGEKALVLPLSFDVACDSSQLPGLLQVLEGEAAHPKILSKEGADYILAGGISRFSAELLRREAFKKLLKEYESAYDWIIGVSHASIYSAEAINLASAFDGVAIVASNETIEAVKAYFEEINPSKMKAITVILQD